MRTTTSISSPRCIQNTKNELPGNSLFLASLPDNALGRISHRWGSDIQVISANQRACVHETRDVCKSEKSDGGEENHIY